MRFEIGEKVIHWNFGLGEIVKIEDKTVHGFLTKCYVLRTIDLTVWIPVNDLQQPSLRVPALPEEFVKLSAILSNPSEMLLEDRLLRKDQLLARMNEGQLSSICRVVRDLTNFKRSARLTLQEKSILEKAVNSLLTEWTYSLGTSLIQARQTMTIMLEV